MNLEVVYVMKRNSKKPRNHGRINCLHIETNPEIVDLFRHKAIFTFKKYLII